MSDPLSERQRLQSCSQEPIRTPGSIQRHGALLGFDRESTRVIFVSENIEEFLGVPPAIVLGITAEELVGTDTIPPLREAAAGANPARITLQGRQYDAIVHRDGPISLVELEPGSDNDELESATAVYAASHRISQVNDPAILLAETAREFRELTGFDHVMIYRFHDDDHGEVVAEEIADPSVETYLGLHFPASDIPQQARELYLSKLSRAIASSTATPVPIVALPGIEPAAVDLTKAELRSVSPVHLQFMRNMGQGSSVSFSVVHRGRLVYMITCADRTERRLPYLVRRSLEVLTNQIALQLGAGIEIETLRSEAVKRELHAALLRGLVSSENLAATLLTGHPTVLDLVAADAAVLRVDGVKRRSLGAPGFDVIERVLREHIPADGASWFESASLAYEYPTIAAMAPGYAGLLVVPIGFDGDYLAFFRREVTRSVDWLGDLREGNRPDSLSPRVSFSAWTQSVTGTSLPWTTARADAAHLAHDLELALERRAQARLAHLALTDPLTGLPNRRFLMDELARILSGTSELSLLFIDLDDFKQVNDTLGHEAGDAVILEVTRRLVAQTRSEDRVVRLGGDEFVVLCEALDKEDADALAGRVITAISEPIAVRDTQIIVTASCGIVARSDAGPDDLVQLADAAMYRAKAQGRNRISR